MSSGGVVPPCGGDCVGAVQAYAYERPITKMTLKEIVFKICNLFFIFLIIIEF